MKGPNGSTPLNLLYRANLEDTAMLVGLASMRTPIRSIYFMDDSSAAEKQYLREVNSWLCSKRLPTINELSKENTSAILISPRIWGWSTDECMAAIRLSGLSLPPSFQPKVERN